MLLKKRVTWKKHLSFMMMAMLILQLLSFAAGAEEIGQASERNQHVRVYLSRLGITDRIDLTLESSYQMQTDHGVNLHFQPGSQLAFILKGDSIYLYHQDMALEAGNGLTLERTQEGGFYQTNFEPFYMGDLRLDVVDGKLRPVLTIHVEDYLLGVVPYEMSELFPLEALKAQAVAARTYALRKQNSENAYDVVDTTNDQVFKGYIPGNMRTEQAVAQTRGICGFYKGELAQCYYSASNGGQMELVETVWPDQGDFGYYAFAKDPYDVENPQSVVRSFELKKNYEDTAPYALRKLIAKTQSELLSEKGFDAAPESIRVDSVLSAVADTPVEPGNERMTMLKLSLRISGRTLSAMPQLIDSDTEEVSLFAVPAATAQSETFPPSVSVSPSPEPKMIYGPFVPIEQEIVLELPIFPDAEAALGMNISGNYENEIWRVQETEESFIVEARRYGHGVGMSQRGAQWMAATYGKNYQEILKFYYPGMELMRYPEQPRRITKPDEALLATAGPAPSPTPRPTLMPVTLEKQDGQWYAEVTEIAEDSSLNLRSEPSLNGTIAMRLYKGQRLLVLERCPEEGWVHVQTDAVEGYVMENYLTQTP